MTQSLFISILDLSLTTRALLRWHAREEARTTDIFLDWVESSPHVDLDPTDEELPSDEPADLGISHPRLLLQLASRFRLPRHGSIRLTLPEARSLVRLVQSSRVSELLQIDEDTLSAEELRERRNRLPRHLRGTQPGLSYVERRELVLFERTLRREIRALARRVG